MHWRSVPFDCFVQCSRPSHCSFAQRYGDTATHTPRRAGDKRHTPFERFEVGLGFRNSLREIFSGRSHRSLHLQVNYL